MRFALLCRGSSIFKRETHSDLAEELLEREPQLQSCSLSKMLKHGSHCVALMQPQSFMAARVLDKDDITKLEQSLKASASIVDFADGLAQAGSLNDKIQRLVTKPQFALSPAAEACFRNTLALCNA